MADGSIIIDTKLDSKGFKEGLGKLGGIAGTAMKAIGTTIVATGTAIAGLGGYALKASIDFESAFAGVRKTVDATEEEFKALEKGIRDMSKVMPQSASEIALVAESAGQLGIKTDAILGFTKTMAMLGDATNMSSEEAATALARLANITGMSQNDFDRLGSTVVALGNNLATTEAEIVEMGLRLAGTATQVGMTEHEMLALAGAMSSVGINAEAGGSSMSRVMQKINTQVLSGGSNLNNFAKISGMSASEFSKAWKDTPSEAILAFTKGLDEVNKSGGDVTSTLKELGISSIQEVSTMLSLAGANEVLADSLELGADAWKENKALMEEAEQRYKTTESLIAILKNNVDDLAISVGDGLKESLRGGIEMSMEWVQQLSNAFNKGGLSGLVTEIGTVLADVVVQVANQAPKLFDAAVNMIKSFINGIQANLPTIMKSAFEMIKSFIDAVITILPQIIELGIELVIYLLQGIAEMLPDLITDIIDLVITICDTIIDNLPLLVEAAVQIILALTQGIMQNLPKLISEVPRIINSFADAIYAQLPLLLMVGVQIIWELIKGLIQSIPTLVANIPQIIMAIVNVFTLYNWANLGKGAITKLKDGILSMKDNVVKTAWNLADNIGKAIVNILKNAGKWGKDMILNLGKSILNGYNSIRTFSSGLGNLVKNAIVNIFQGAFSWGRNMVTAIGNAIRGGFSLVSGAARSIGTGAINAIKGAFSGSSSLGRNLVQGIWNGISNMTGWILSKIKGFGKSVINGMKSIFGIKSPSRVMRDQVGNELVRGIDVGIEKEMPSLEQSINKEMRALTAKMKATVDIESNIIGAKLTAGSMPKKESNNVINNNNNGVTQNVTIVNPKMTPSENARALKKVGRDLAFGY